MTGMPDGPEMCSSRSTSASTGLGPTPTSSLDRRGP
jgi:hypothetical protein